MKNIYILTKEGNSFNEKGQRSVHEQIRKAYNEKEDEQFMDNLCTPIRDEHHRLVAEGLAEPIEGEKY